MYVCEAYVMIQKYEWDEIKMYTVTCDRKYTNISDVLKALKSKSVRLSIVLKPFPPLAVFFWIWGT